MKLTAPSQAPGPYRVDQIREAGPYELPNGHRIECMSTGRDHTGTNLLGASVLVPDLNVEWAGVDAGYALKTLERWLARGATRNFDATAQKSDGEE